MNTNFCFDAGKLTILSDAGAGSSGKGVLGSFVTEHADNWQFCCNTFTPQAGHWVKLDDGRTYFYQTFNSCAYNHEKFEKMYIGHGAGIELSAFFKELESNNIPAHKIGISPITAILQDIDAQFERGEVDLDGNRLKEVGLGTMAKGSTCLNRNMRIETEDGQKTIKEIVDTRYNGKVLSIDDGRFIYKHITGYKVENNYDKKWVSLNSKNNKKKLICTDDHKCLVVDDIIYPSNMYYISIKDAVDKFSIMVPDNRCKDNKLYNNEQVSAMIGSLFGDGQIHKCSFMSEHGDKQKEYAFEKEKLFYGKIKNYRSGWNKNNISHRVITLENAQTKYMRNLFYDGSQKTIKNALKYLNDIGLAFWYMDDGTLNIRKNKSPTSVFCTDNFSKEDNNAIIEFLSSKYDIDSIIDYRNRIRLTVDGSKKLWKIINKYIFDCMDYKIPKDYRSINKHNYDYKLLNYAAKHIEEVKYLPSTNHYNSKLYDIEIEDTHNFIANGVVVHNCHGCGALKARKILRKNNVLLARDVPELKEFICDVPNEIMNRLDRGQSGLLEIAQGFQLSYGLPEFYPYTTSRNCTVTAALDDLMLPIKYAGNILLNYRTYPIRINNKKFIGEDGHHLVWDEIQSGVPHTVKVYNSGPGYNDQEEIEWDYITKQSGSPEPVMEMTSVTKLPRRCFTFSKKNLIDSIKYNDTGHKIILSLNFVNYVDYKVFGSRNLPITDKLSKWLDENIYSVINGMDRIELKILGTGPLTDDKIIL